MSKDILRRGTSAIEHAMDRVNQLVPPGLPTRRELRQAVGAVEPRAIDDFSSAVTDRQDIEERNMGVIRRHQARRRDGKGRFTRVDGKITASRPIPVRAALEVGIEPPKISPVKAKPERPLKGDRGIIEEQLADEHFIVGRERLDTEDQASSLSADLERSWNSFVQAVANGEIVAPGIVLPEPEIQLLGQETGGVVFDAGLIKG